MREFLYKLAARLKAPLWLRAYLLPAENVVPVSTIGESVQTSLPVILEVRSFAEEIAADLAELGIELFPKPPKPSPKKLGFFRALAAVRRYWLSEVEDRKTVVAGGGIVAAGAAAVVKAAGEGVVAAGAARAAVAAALVAAGAALLAGVVGVVVVAAAAAGGEDSLYNLYHRKNLVTVFWLLLFSTALLLFTPAPWWADLLLPLLGASWVGQALWRMVKSRKTEVKAESSPPPLTAEQLYSRVVGAVTTAIESHRTKALEGDSALKGVITAREKDLETLKRVRDELEVLAQRGEDRSYVTSRLTEVSAGLAELEQEIARATAAKEEFLARLRRLEAHLPNLNRFVTRRRIDETIVRIRAKAADFARETDTAFLTELRSLRNDVAPLLAALERLTHALMGADETLLLEQMFEEVEKLSAASGEAAETLSA